MAGATGGEGRQRLALTGRRSPAWARTPGTGDVADHRAASRCRLRRCRASARVAVALLLGVACLPPPSAGIDPELHVNAGVAPAPLDGAPLAAEPGFAELSWNVDGVSHSASVWAPERRPRSAIVMLHGAIVVRAGMPRMEPLDVARRMLRCLAVPAFEGSDPLLIAPHSVDGQWWKKDDTAFVLGLVAAARERWPELASRSVITGYSNGGIAAWYFARLYPEWFSAAIPMAFNDMIVGPTRVPVYAIQGDKDELFPIEPVRAAVARERAQGVDVTLAERHRAGHMTPCEYAPELRDAGAWLEQHAFARGAEPPAAR